MPRSGHTLPRGGGLAGASLMAWYVARGNRLQSCRGRANTGVQGRHVPGGAPFGSEFGGVHSSRSISAFLRMNSSRLFFIFKYIHLKMKTRRARGK